MLTFFLEEDYKVAAEGQFAGFFFAFCADNKHAEAGFLGGIELRWRNLLSIGVQNRVTSLRGNKMSKGKGQF